ncbi:tyrosine-type recombinase/integrase [Salinicoccus albus]|uniref:tyrosine-type recombinase/integrase n=1 Tax=Salinicoccus albus TaxID=418756 RepID=UPI00248128D9|nr:tyrosine-type recombinase/integrase [Salinicoccus albus]
MRKVYAQCKRRQYYAKTMVENGANVFELQKLPGHRSLEMVRVYVNLFDKHIFDAHKKYFPTNHLFRD